MKKIISILLVLMMLLSASVCLFACDGNGGEGEQGGENEGEQNGENGGEQGGETGGNTENDGKVTYTIYVVDNDGNAVVGAKLQICDSNGCSPILKGTDEEGKVTASKEPSDFKAQIRTLPEGYTEIEAGVYHYFDANNTVTITVNKSAE